MRAFVSQRTFGLWSGIFPIAAIVFVLLTVADLAVGDWGAAISAEETYSNNIRSQQGPSRQDDFVTLLGGGFGWVQNGRNDVVKELSLMVKGRIFAGLSSFDYYEIRPRAVFEYGRNELTLEYHLMPDRLFFDRSDGAGPGVFYTGHGLVGEVVHKFGQAKRLRVNLSWELVWRNFDPPDDERDDLTVIGGVSIRYSVARIFVPQVGIEYGERNATRDNFDRDQSRLIVGFASNPVSWARARVTYKVSRRTYTVSRAQEASGRRNRNFAREDTLHNVEVSVMFPVPWVDGAVLRARYKYRQSYSARPGRSFDRSEFGLELAYSHGGLSW